MTDKNNYYIKKKSKFMKDFDDDLTVAKEILESRFDVNKVEQTIKSIREKYETMLPEIPYIGGQKNPTTLILLRCVSNLAIFFELEKEGFSFNEIGEFYYQYSIGNHMKRKRILEKAGRDPSLYPFNETYVEYQKNLCENTHKKEFSGDWVMEFVEGDGANYDWGWDIYECGVQKAYKALKGEKYLPFICLGDHYEAEVLGFGFSRTQTLGFGAPLCDHRFIKNGKIAKAWPPDELEEFNPDYWEES